jgi:hypothetical protein
MNLFGKILVFLILIMSVVFMTMALIVYATHKNWKEEITRTPAEAGAGGTVGWKARWEQLVQQNQKLTADNEALQKAVVVERTVKAEALAKMQTELAARVADLTTAKNELAQHAQQLATATATLKTQDENVNIATKQVQQLTQDLNVHIARVTELFNRSMKLNNDLMLANAQLPELKEMNTELAAQIAKARTLLQQVGRNLEDPIDRRPPPLDANVELVTLRDVEIAAGTDDGVRVGHMLDIVSVGRAGAGRIVGRIEITNVDEDRAVGRILREYSVEQIRRGDIATTKLNRLARPPAETKTN